MQILESFFFDFFITYITTGSRIGNDGLAWPPDPNPAVTPGLDSTVMDKKSGVVLSIWFKL